MQPHAESNPDSVAHHALLQQIRQLVETEALTLQREMLANWAAQLQIEPIDCAAALLLLTETRLPKPDKTVLPAPDSQNKIRRNHNRLVRYRLDVGSQHQISREQIQALLIAESGVDKKRIGRIDIRHNHTLVELPDGMPADIFQILFETTLADRKLAIKRIKSNRRFKSRDS